MCNYCDLIKQDRIRKSSVPNRTILEESSSDRSRVTFSSAFRRLQNKAQVFPLERNAAIRTRLTHSLEVADTGRLIAQNASQLLNKKELLCSQLMLPFTMMVETGCLLHDIGNPPFGHFGEHAIRGWFNENWQRILEKSFNSGLDEIKDAFRLKYLPDFIEFDGNAQGIRIVTFLQETPNSKDFNGLNLTCSQILSSLKYVRCANDTKGDGILAKAGYFETERKTIVDIKKTLSHPEFCRFPLAYIVEAADDIAYCLSDIEDGIVKKLITANDFFAALIKEFGGNEKFKRYVDYDIAHDFNEGESKFFEFKTNFTREVIKFASEEYVKKHDMFINGKISDLIEKDSEFGKMLSCLKNIARKDLFRTEYAERPELAGYSIISELLTIFSRLLFCTRENFESIINSRENPNLIKGKELDLHVRLFDRLPSKYVEAYKSKANGKNSDEELFHRAHLITDFISGMTDTFAHDLYLMLRGVVI